MNTQTFQINGFHCDACVKVSTMKIKKISGFENKESSSCGEFKEKLDLVREQGIECRMLPTSGCYTLHIDYGDFHNSCYGETSVRYALDKLLEE